MSSLCLSGLFAVSRLLAAAQLPDFLKCVGVWVNVSLSEAKLCGEDIASVDMNTLDVLHIASLEDREQLLSAIYNELHPPTTVSQRLDSLLGTLLSKQHNKQTFTWTVCK